MTTITEAGPSVRPRRSIGLGDLIRTAIVGALALGLMYIVWGLYLAGEPLFAVVTMALLIGIVIVFGTRRFYTARFVFPAVTAKPAQAKHSANSLT